MADKPEAGAPEGTKVEEIDMDEKRRRLIQARKKDDPLYYGDYLQLHKVLGAQSMKSEEAGFEAHDEHLFIVIHQVYELWFKQILFELDSVRKLFSAEYVHERSIGVAVQRLHRVTEIQRVLLDQLAILETMSPLDFLDFRDFLYPASGFQSAQFRLVENKLGLRADKRLAYTRKSYCTYLNSTDMAEVTDAEKEPSLFELVEKWLERTPFTKMGTFDFWEHYTGAAKNMVKEERESIRGNPSLDEAAAKEQLKDLDETEEHFLSLVSEERYKKLQERGDWRLSHGALRAALLITLYHGEPILQLPYRLLQVLIDIDELMTSWRYRHATMVHRMLGMKVGTGGSSGYHYLRNTAQRHKIFSDFFNISTYLLPRHALPPLPEEVRKALGFSAETSVPGMSGGGGGGGRAAGPKAPTASTPSEVSEEAKAKCPHLAGLAAKKE